jgi:hypothetical protein
MGAKIVKTIIDGTGKRRVEIYRRTDVGAVSNCGTRTLAAAQALASPLSAHSGFAGSANVLPDFLIVRKSPCLEFRKD